MSPWKASRSWKPCETPPNPRLERTGGWPIRSGRALVATGRSSVKRWPEAAPACVCSDIPTLEKIAKLRLPDGRVLRRVSCRLVWLLRSHMVRPAFAP